MLTFEKVLEVFKDYLAEDTNCEVVLTKHGYTVIQLLKIATNDLLYLKYKPYKMEYDK